MSEIHNGGLNHMWVRWECTRVGVLWRMELIQLVGFVAPLDTNWMDMHRVAVES